MEYGFNAVFPKMLIRIKFKRHRYWAKVFDEYVKNNVIDDISPDDWSAPVHTSFKKDINSDIDKALLESQIERAVRDALGGYELDVLNSWWNVYTKGMYQERHHHCGGSILSGIYAIKNANKPPVRFHNDDTPILHAMGQYDRYNGSPWDDLCGSKIDPYYEDGDILLFHSHFMHEVPYYREDDYRITVSFNLGKK